jgi:hypothetical protein
MNLNKTQRKAEIVIYEKTENLFMLHVCIFQLTDDNHSNWVDS